MENNLLTRTTDLAMAVTSRYIKEGDLLIDATCGNGNDTFAFSKMTGLSGHVLAIDIQEKALETAQNTTCRDCNNIVYKLGNFRDVDTISQEIFPGIRPKAVIFNLGYLPGGDKSITTGSEDSLIAVKKAVQLIETNGIVTLVLYCGHPQGKDEKTAILNWAEGLSSSDYHVVYNQMLNQRKNPPEILFITRKR